MNGDNGKVGRDRLLIVDDEPDVRALFRDIAEDLGFIVAEAGDQGEFLAAYDALDPTVILLDLTLPGADGVELLRDLAGRKCTTPILLASGKDARVLATAQRLGRMLGLVMQGVLQKPITVPDLETALSEVLTGPPAISVEDFERAIDQSELVLHFQPKIDLRRADIFPIVGSEALVRWMHPVRGLVPPGEFIPLAEDSGLIGPMTEVVLRDAVAQLAAWRNQGFELPVSVNLSPRQLTDLTLPDRMIALLTDAGLDPSLLVAEITEQAAMSDIGKATDILTRLRLKDIAVSLDDFGAGYSSLVEIYRMPLSELKLDRSLIVDLDNDPDARTVVKALVALARELGLPVCAEGVETDRTAAFLQSIGCEKAQGYFFSKPLPAEDFATLASGLYHEAPNRSAPLEHAVA